MYADSRKQLNAMVGCFFQCVYCTPSFKAQMKRRKHDCMDCYNYVPHFHPERLKGPLPKTPNGTFIWMCSSSDISFAKREWMEQILEFINQYPDRTFLLQSKNPIFFSTYSIPDNVVLCTTLETDDDELYQKYNISKAPLPTKRQWDFDLLPHERKFITIEPILKFKSHDHFVGWFERIQPERIYIGYDSKNCGLPSPPVGNTVALIEDLRKQGFDVRTKLIPPKQPKITEWL